jgi:tripartite ATP-independent transporter DctM subunit
MTTIVQEPVASPRPPRPVAAFERIAHWLGVYSDAAARIATVGAIVASVVALLAVVGNIFTRQVLGFSLFGSNELAKFAFLWVIWMGISLAVRREAVTVITLLSHNGPALWQRSVRTFSGLSLGMLLAYSCWRTTEFALGEGAPLGVTSALGISWFYPVASMAVGYYFITLHYLRQVADGAVELVGRGRAGVVATLTGLAGGVAIGAAVWLVLWVLLEIGADPLIAIGVLFVALTMAGTPVVFMLAIVGIVAMFAPSFFGLTFYPFPDPITPFFTSQSTMGLSGGGELLVILMFLIVAEVMNASGLSNRLIAFAAAVVGHLRGGMAYVAQLTSAALSGISGSAQADAAIMTPLLVPAMEREGYRRDVAAAVVAGASIKGPIGPLSVMFIVYGVVVQGPAGVSISELLLSGVMAEILLLIFQAATVYIVVRKMDFLAKRPFAGWAAVGRTGVAALPVLGIPVIILGGIFTGVFTPSESGAIAAIVTIGLALFWFSSMSPLQLPGMIATAALETGIVMLLLGDSSILGKALFNNGFGQTVQDWLTGLTHDKYVFLLIVNVLLLLVGIFIEPLPALYILGPFLAPIAVVQYGMDPVHFGLIMVFNLVIGLIHPPVGLVIFMVSSLAKVSIERLSVMILPWLAVSLVVLFLVTYLPSQAVLALAHLLD